MKKDLHPSNYRLVVFQDTSSDFKILTRSTVATSEKTKWEDGNEYPLVKVHVSSASHPFFTGEEKIMDIEGRVDKFKARTEAAKKAREAKQAVAKKSNKSDESEVTSDKKAAPKAKMSDESEVTSDRQASETESTEQKAE